MTHDILGKVITITSGAFIGTGMIFKDEWIFGCVIFSVIIVSVIIINIIDKHFMKGVRS